MISGAVYVQCYFIERWIGDQIKYRSSTRATIGIRICFPLNISIKFFFCNVLVLAILFFTSGNGIHNLALR